jgi:prophage antirepressor-like protein
MFDEETDTTIPVPVESSPIENEQELEFFFDDKVRKIWHKQQEEWYFSIVDVCQVLTDSVDGRKYWNKLKQRLVLEGNETVTNCHQLKMKASDGKMRKTDCASTEQLLRIIQSIPSKKAEPFKLWLAQVGKERLDETADPELAFERMIRTYRQKGYSEAWIQQRLRSIDIRKALTDEWKNAGVDDSKDYATLTNILTQAWSGKTVSQYKQYKGLHKESLRDNMTNLELTLNQLAEVSATALSQAKSPKGMSESKVIAKEGGNIAGNARKDLEERLGRSVISPLNAQDPPLLDDQDN